VGRRFLSSPALSQPQTSANVRSSFFFAKQRAPDFKPYMHPEPHCDLSRISVSPLPSFLANTTSLSAGPTTMARNMARGKVVPSSELGDGNWGTTHNKRTGRPIRKAPNKANSPFVDSAIAITDEESDGSEAELILKPRKRKRSPSPPLSEANEDLSDSDLSIDNDVDDFTDDLPRRQQAVTTTASASTSGAMQITLKEVTINVPAGHQGPLVLQLEPLLNTPKLATPPAMAAASKAQKISNKTRSRRKSTPKAEAAPAGFLDLPAELRNEIYRLVFVADHRLSFANPANFSRGAAFLRTCSQVHAEGRSILYGENEFFFNRRTSRYGSLWENDWHEVGYRSARRFLKSIGPTNTSLIRQLTLQFEDATPCLNPETMSHDDRRFVNDKVLMSVLRHLGDYGALEVLKINFHGRRRVEMADRRFLGYLRRIHADEVEFVRFPIGRGVESYWTSESKQEEPVKKMLLKAMVRKQKLYA
jgi:hypothetical protein